MDFNITNPFHCELPVQLRFSDLDTLGHVNNSVYLNLFDLGKSIYFEQAAGERQDWNNVNVVRTTGGEDTNRPCGQQELHRAASATEHRHRRGEMRVLPGDGIS